MEGECMKICILDTIEKDGSGGAVTHKWELSRNLAKFGHEVHAMTYEAKLEGIVAHPLKSKEKYIFKFVFKVKHLMHILKVLRMNNFDILYTRKVSFALLVQLIKGIGILKGAKLVLELNGLFSIYREYLKKRMKLGLSRDIRMAIMDYLEIIAAKKADAVIAVSPGIKDLLIKRGVNGNKVVIIPNGANIDMFRPIKGHVIDEIRRKYDIKEDTHVVMFVGSLTYWQGIDYLIQSIPLVLKVMPNTVFFIVGDGELKNELIHLAEKMNVANKCIFTGKIPYEKVPLYINIADVCVDLKKNLPFGYSSLKLYEYMACEKPVVASNIIDFEILKK